MIFFGTVIIIIDICGHVVREREIDRHIVHQNTSTNSTLCSVERPWDHKFCLTFLVY